jgi:hypothetical protein
VLAVGALNAKSEYVDFSSKGPSADNEVKPNVMAQGSGSVLAALDGGTFTGSGTSFSGPILCGAATCLWQAIPKAKNMDVFRAIERSADRYTQPNERFGFGIPNFGLAYLELKSGQEELEFSPEGGAIQSFPLPFTDVLYVHIDPCCNASSADVVLYDTFGREAYRSELVFTAAAQQLLTLRSVAALPSGVYLLTVNTGGTTYTKKVVKGFSSDGN